MANLEGAVAEVEQQNRNELYKSIKIETVAIPWLYKPTNSLIGIYAINSHITLSEPINYSMCSLKDFKLNTEWRLQEGKPYLESYLFDLVSANLQIKSDPFNQLDEPFESYSDQRLKKWREDAFKQHNLYLRKLEDLYWQGKELPKDFFNLP